MSIDNKVVRQVYFSSAIYILLDGFIVLSVTIIAANLIFRKGCSVLYLYLELLVIELTIFTALYL